MKNNDFSNLLESNKQFWSGINKNDESNGCLLYEMFYAEPSMIYGVSKTALTIAYHRELKPICITGLRGSKERFELINSMNNCVTGKPLVFALSSAKNIFGIIKYFLSVKSKRKLLDLTIDGCNVGEYIYDAVLRTLNLPEIKVFSFEIRKIVLLELCYFYFFKSILDKFNVKTIVLGDNVYRCGLLFELAKQKNIECITPINLNGYSMRKYQCKDDFYLHDRKPEKMVLDMLDSDEIKHYLDEYFSRRFSASLEQHDVMKAFSCEKTIYSRGDIIEMYGLNNELPIVIVMSHIFCDAPHAYPETLYDDYKEWLVNTVSSLKKNKKVNFLVKEHPSADLYNEKGVINSILRELGCENLVLKDDVHSLTILNEFDVVITCGGTIGQEFAYKGKPVVLGAKPPYSGFGFTEEPKSRSEYEAFMQSGVENLNLLNAEQRDMVNRVIYHDFVLLDNYSDKLEIGGERFYMGRPFNYDKFSDQVINYNKTPLNKQIISKKLKKFVESKEKHLIREYGE